MRYRIAKTSPGITWVRRGWVYRGYDYSAHLWLRSFWRVLWLWLAAVGVLGFVGWGLGR